MLEEGEGEGEGEEYIGDMEGMNYGEEGEEYLDGNNLEINDLDI